MALHVARLHAPDAAAYRRLMLQAYATEPDAFTSTAEERAPLPASFWLRRIEDPAGRSSVWGAFSGLELCGAVALERFDKPRTAHKAHLLGMYVAAAYRGQGAGRALLDAALQHARSVPDLRVVVLTVTEGNRSAMQLYQGAGFQTFGIEPLAIRTDSGFHTKVHMRLEWPQV